MAAMPVNGIGEEGTGAALGAEALGAGVATGTSG